MKFKIPDGKRLFVGGVVKSYKSGEYETTDKAEIEALSGAEGVTKVTTKQGKTEAE